MDMDMKLNLVRHLRLTRIKNGDYLDKILTDDDLDALADSILSKDSPVTYFISEDHAEEIEELQDEIKAKENRITFLREILKNAAGYVIEASDSLAQAKAVLTR